MSPEDCVKELDAMLTKYQAQKDFILEHKDYLREIEETDECHTVLWSDNPRVSFKFPHTESKEVDFKHFLLGARFIMRTLCGSWKDKVRHVWSPYTDAVIIAYKDENHPIELWIETTIEHFPEELKPSKTCEWKKSVFTYNSLVCEAPNES